MASSAECPRWCPRILRILRVCAGLVLSHSAWKVLRYALSWARFHWHTRGLAGEPADLLGHEVKKNVLRLNDWHAECLLAHAGKSLVRRASPEQVVFCNSAESVRMVLKDRFDVFTKPSAKANPMFEMLERFLGSGIFVVRHGEADREEHERWVRQRKTAARIFTKNVFEQLAHETFVEKAANIVRCIEEVAERNEKVNGNGREDGAHVLDLQEKFFAYTFDSIQKIFFDEDVDSVTGEPDVYAVAFDAAHRSMMKYLYAFIPYHLLSRHLLPYPLGDISPNHLNSGFFVRYLRQKNPDYRNFEKNVDFLRKETQRRVTKMRKDPNLPNRRDLIGNFLNFTTVQGGQPLPDKEICDLVLNFILAGRDTTACALSWLFYELSINPDVQDKLALELREVLGGKVPTLDDLKASNLPYLNGVVYETLRLHPPVPVDMKIATADVTFPDGTVLPKGTKVAFSPYVFARDPARYPNPLKFDPTRWIPFTVPDPYEFPVFQAGPRICLGQAFSIFETKVLIAQLLQRFTFDLLDGEQDKIGYALMLTMSITNSPDKKSHNLWIVPRIRA